MRKLNLAKDYFSEKYFFEEKFSKNFENGNYETQILYFPQVFRRHHVVNDPINFLDPQGTFRLPSSIMDEAMENPNSDSGSNGMANAFQHCFASCMMTAENGEIDSNVFGWMNEVWNDYNGQSRAARQMDEHNNQVGNELAKQCNISNRLGVTQASHQNVSKKCQSACLSAASSGKLKTLGE